VGSKAEPWNQLVVIGEKCQKIRRTSLRDLVYASADFGDEREVSQILVNKLQGMISFAD